MAKVSAAKVQKDAIQKGSVRKQNVQDGKVQRPRSAEQDRKCECGKILHLSTSTSSVQCTKCRIKNALAVERQLYQEGLCNRFDNLRIVEFAPTMLVQSKFRCLVGGHDFKARPYDVMSYKKDCCPKCAKGKGKPIKSKAVLDALLKGRGVKSIGEFQGLNKQRSFRCLRCREKTTTTPGRMMVNGCRMCKTKDEKLVALKRNVMKILTTAKGVSTSDVETFKLPAIVYRWMGQDKEYLPDFLVKGRTVVLVESMHWLFHSFKAYVEKAKAAVKAGYRVRVAVYAHDADDSIAANPSALLLEKDWYSKSEEEVRAYVWRKQLPVDRIRMLSVDPGTSNFAWSALEVRFDPLTVNVLATGMLQSPMKAMSGDIRLDVKGFKSEIRSIIEEYDLKFLAAERYMTRGIKGTTIEAVNAMLGVLVTMFDQHPWQRYELVMASQWKNEWNRYSNLEGFYKLAKCEVHQADSMGIGLYCAYRWSAQKPFHDLKSRVRSLAKQLSKNNVMGCA